MKNIIFITSLLFSLSVLAHVETETFSDLGVDKIFHSSPVDDPNAYHVENVPYEVKASPYYWVLPGPGESENVKSLRSNNNVAIEFFGNRLFLAFRTGKTHFAGKKTRMYVISSADGKNWDKEWESETGHDSREPQLISYKGQLHFYYFTAGTSPFKFEPQKIFKVTRNTFRDWSTPEQVMEDGEIHWEMKVRNGVLWSTSYLGSHYRVGGGAKVKLMLKKSVDGKIFKQENDARESVYIGGVSEAGWEFDDEGNMWAVTRNEDGDISGFGSHLCYAPSYDLSYWTMQPTSLGYESPRMFRHGKEIYLVARRQLNNSSYGWSRHGGFWWRRIVNLVHYSATAKTTALFRMNQETLQVEHVMDLPGAGDTAFPSIRRVDEHTFLIANYTSPLNRKYRKWFIGQLGHTKIYLIALKFVKKASP